MDAENLIREALAYIDKSLDNVADLDVVWENAEVVEVLEDVRSLLVTGEINPGSFEKAQAPTDEDQGPSANCAYCVGSGGYEDHEGSWVECSACNRLAQKDFTDAQVRAALTEWYRGIFGGGWTGEHEVRMRAALKVAFTAGQEEQS